MRTVTIAATLIACATTFGYPPPRFFVEMQPPTLEDWHNLHMRRLERKTCDLCGPIMIPGEIRYYPCPPEQSCDRPTHQSFQGVYGSVHPAPYYLPAPRIAVHVPGRCPRCASRQDWRFRQELPAIVEKIEE